jgi:hypothetical protein
MTAFIIKKIKADQPDQKIDENLFSLQDGSWLQISNHQSYKPVDEFIENIRSQNGLKAK